MDLVKKKFEGVKSGILTLADPGKLLTGQEVNNTLSANDRFKDDVGFRPGNDLTDDRSPGRRWMIFHDPQRGLGAFRWHKRDKSAFTSHIQGIESQKLARAFDILADRDFFSSSKIVF